MTDILVNQHFYLLTETQQNAINNVIEAMYVNNEGRHIATEIKEPEVTKKYCYNCKYRTGDYISVCQQCDPNHSKWRIFKENDRA